MANEEHPESTPGEGEKTPRRRPEETSPLEPDLDWLMDLEGDVKPTPEADPNAPVDDFLELDVFKTEAPAAPKTEPAPAPTPEPVASRGEELWESDLPAAEETAPFEDLSELSTASAIDETLRLGVPDDAPRESGEALRLGVPDDAPRESGEALRLGVPDDVWGEERGGPSGPEPGSRPVSAPAKPPAKGRARMVAALVAAAAIPSAGVYFSQRNELEQAQRRLAEVEGDAAKGKAAVDQPSDTKKKLDEATQKAEAEAKAKLDALSQLESTKKLLTELQNKPPAPEKTATPPARGIEPGFLTQTAQDVVKSEKAPEALRNFAKAAVDSKDGGAPDKLFAALEGSLTNPADIRKKIQEVNEAIKNASSGEERSRLGQIQIRLKRKLSAAGKGAGKQGFLPGRAPGSVRLGASGRPARILRVAFQPPAPPAMSPDEQDLLQTAEQATRDDPENASAFQDLGEVQLELALARKAANKNADAIVFLDAALASFRKAGTLLNNSPGSDTSGTVALKLYNGTDLAARERIAMPVAAVPPVPQPPGQPGPSQAQLDAAVKAQKAAEEKLATATEALGKVIEERGKEAGLRMTAQGQVTELTGKLNDTNGKLNTERAESARYRDADQVWARFAQTLADARKFNDPKLPAAPERWDSAKPATLSWIESLAAVLSQPGGTTTGGTASAPRKPVSLPRQELGLATYAEGLARLDRCDLPGAEAKFTEAIGWNPEDARFYYFRALVRYLNAGGSGDPVDALRDIRIGAWLEQMNQPPTKVVGKSLTEIQDGLRDWLEARRRPGRLLMSASGPDVPVVAPAPAATSRASVPAWVESIKPELR